MEFLSLFIFILWLALATPSTTEQSVGSPFHLESPHLANLSTAPPPSAEISFSLPLIHRSSPRSPFYNPNLTKGELFRESLERSRKRARYLSRAWGVSRFQIPVTTDFCLRYSIGTPPIETYGVPDTGSDLVWLQCEPCEDCYDQNPPIFYSEESSSYKVVSCYSYKCSGFGSNLSCDDEYNCGYSITYADGSYSRGNIAEEMITVDSQRFAVRFSLIFGCGFNNNDTVGKKYPGVIGLQNSQRSLIGQLQSTAFSYCYDAKNRGSLQVGKESARLWGSSTPLVQNSIGKYLVILEDIMVNDEGLDLPQHVFQHVINRERSTMSGVAIDSGSFTTHLHHMAFDVFLSKVSTHMKEKGRRMTKFLSLFCWENPGGVKDPSLPTISLMFRDLKVILDQNAWYQVDQDTCLMFLRNSQPITLIGLYQQRGANVGYDLKNMILRFQYQSKCLP